MRRGCELREVFRRVPRGGRDGVGSGLWWKGTDREVTGLCAFGDGGPDGVRRADKR